MKRALQILLVIVVVLFAIIIIQAIVNPSGQDQYVSQQTSKEQTFRQDSIGLMSLLQDSLIMGNDAELDIIALNHRTCRIWITVPKQIGLNYADVIGKDCCALTARYLYNNDYDIASSNFTITCWINSPYKGVTGREGLVTQWGVARYIPQTDSVNWEWTSDEDN